MKAIMVRSALALVLFAAGAVCWAESRRARQMADAHERLVTLHYDVDRPVDEATTVTDRLPARLGSLRDEARRHRTTVQYWLAEYDDLTAPAETTESDPERLFVAANAAYRASQLDERSNLTEGPKIERRAAAPASQAPSGVQGSLRSNMLKKLDSALQAYATALRATPRHADAAYNYEYVARVRDMLAKARPSPVRPVSKDQPRVAVARRTTDDLPAGRTLHGQPGAPPPATRGNEFDILAPMQFDERESQPEANPGVRLDRKG
jgi:hypothetical protein